MPKIPHKNKYLRYIFWVMAIVWAAPGTGAQGAAVSADDGARDYPNRPIRFILPGGPGSTGLMEDAELLGFLREREPRAQWITSVCTGALVLGAAGLLRGYRAATHWSVMDLLPVLGAIPVSERVVIDRNRVTGGGVTAGIDFALTLIAHIWGEDQAKLIQLGNEYDPAPPFDAGHPDRVPDVAAHYRGLTGEMTAARRAAAAARACRRKRLDAGRSAHRSPARSCAAG